MERVGLEPTTSGCDTGCRWCAQRAVFGSAERKGRSFASYPCAADSCGLPGITPDSGNGAHSRAGWVPGTIGTGPSSSSDSLPVLPAPAAAGAALGLLEQ